MDAKITYQNKDKEMLFVVDENSGKIDKTKFASKKEIHKNHLWHNEAALFIINTKGKILLQKRSDNVHFNKGKWGMVANHPNINQTNIQSIIEKAEEELGLCLDEKSIMFLTLAKRDDEQKNKFAYFYYTKTNIKDEDIKIEPYLTTEYKWWDFEKLKEKMLENNPETVFKNIPFYVYVFKQLEKIIKGIDTNKTIKYKEFLISETADKVQLPCVLHRPKSATKNIAIFVHGSGGNFFKQSYLNDIVNRLTYSGFAFMTTNNRGAEQETHLYKLSGKRYERFKAGSKFEDFDESYYDIDSFVKLAQEQGYKNIVLIGHSLGTLKVLNYALKNKKISKIILMSPVDMIFRFRERVHEKYDHFISQAKTELENGNGDKMLTDEFSAKKIYTTFRIGSTADTIAIEEERTDRVLDYSGSVEIIKGTSDHVYGTYSTEYVDEALRHEFKNAKLEIHNIQNANHAYKGCEKQVSTLLANSVEKLLKK